MDSQIAGIITLLRSALKNEPEELPEGFNLDRAVPVLYKHHLVGLGLRGAARCGVSRELPAMQKLTAMFCADAAKNRLQIQQTKVIFALFEEHGIEYMPVKGAVLKSLYPQSALRAMGDADVLIHQEQYPQIRELLFSIGMTEEIESDHHYSWQAGDFKLELHKRLIPSYDRDYYAYYGNGWGLARQVGQSSAYYLGPEDHFIYLLTHFAKHYRGGSISAKSICDFWIWRNTFPDMEEAYLSAELQKLKLLDFYRNILDLLNTWFEGAAPTKAVEQITQTAFRGSVFGFEETMAVVSLINLTQKGFSISRSRWIFLLRTIFPAGNVLKLRYPILKKAPLLLPAAWVARWFEVFFRHHSRIRRTIAVSRNMIQTDSGRLRDYEELLCSVGLGFHALE